MGVVGGESALCEGPQRSAVYVARVRGVQTASTLWKANLSPEIPETAARVARLAKTADAA